MRFMRGKLPEKGVEVLTKENMKKIFFIFFLIFFWGFTDFSFSQASVESAAPDFRLNDLSGAEITLSEYIGKKGVVIWVTNLCSGCQSGIALLEKLHKKYAGKIEILAILLPDVDVEEARAIKERRKASFPFLLDASGETPNSYGGVTTSNICPLNNIFFIDKRGVIKGFYHYPGLNEKELEDYLALIS